MLLGAQMETTTEVPMSVKKRGLYVEVWRRLRKNRMAVISLYVLAFLVIMALAAHWIAPYAPNAQDASATLQGPSIKHWLGTDEYGRDILSRIVYGSRVSLTVGLVAVVFSVVIGGIIGAIAGYYGRHLDNILMRIMDVILAIPGILLAIAIVNALGPGLINVMIAVGIASIPTYARIVRAAVMSIREQEFIESAKAIGQNDISIIFGSILPNSLSPIIVQVTLGVAWAILSAAGLSFLGLGVQPPTAEWGAILNEGRQYLFTAWWISTFPGLAIVIVVLALNIFGDGLRDALDPRLRN